MKAIGTGVILVALSLLTYSTVASINEAGKVTRPKAFSPEPTSSEIIKHDDYLTIVCTVDGIVHGVDKFGNVAWSTSTGLPMLSAQNYAAHHPDEDAVRDGSDEEDSIDTEKYQIGAGKRKGYSILPSTDGTLIYHSLEGMRKTSVTARHLVEQTPFVSGEGISFTGKKSSRLIKIDTVSGVVLFDTDADYRTGAAVSASVESDAVPVWVGRIDYTLEAVNTATGQQEFNFTYSELIPLPYDSQYHYGQPQKNRGGVEGREQVQELGDDFEVATDVQLEEAEVVGLLGARASSEAWSVEDVDDFNLAQESSQLGAEPDEGGVVSSGSKVVFPDREEEPSPRTRVGKVKRKRGRRRRKSRVSMEKRAAAATTKPGLSETASLRQLELLDVSTAGLISTPDGQLFFSDRDGTVVEKFSLNLRSPVFSAFRLQRSRGGDNVGSNPVSALPSPPSSDGGASGAWGVHAIVVHHRVLTYPLAAELSLSASPAAHQGLAVSGGEVPPEPKRIIVQSPFSQEDRHGDDATGGPLFVLEVMELEMPGPNPGAGAHHEVPLLDSPHPTKRELREKSKEGRLRGQAPAAPRAPAQEKELLHRKNLLRPGASVASLHTGLGRRPLSTMPRRTKGLHAPASLRLHDGGAGPDTASLVLPEGRSLDLGWFEEEEACGDCGGMEERSGSLAHQAQEWCALGASRFYVPASWIPGLAEAALDTCSEQESSPDDTDFLNAPDRGRALNARSAGAIPRGANLHPKNSNGMRGSHTLRPDLYEGTLFRSDPAVLSLDAQLHLFRGVLSSGHQAPPRTASAEQSWEGWRDGAERENTGNPPLPNLPAVVKPNQRDWLDALALKVLALVEHFLLNLIAVAIVVAVVFALCVHFVRTSPAYAHLLPVGATFAGHLHFAFHAVVRKVLFGAAGAPLRVDPEPKQRETFALSVTVPSATTSKVPDLIVPALSLLPPPEASTQGSAVTADSTALPLEPVALSSADSPRLRPSADAPEETVDADGKRLLRVGALQIHCEHILGYGSHGTTVYRGSLDGRPLAVKRILTQFVRSADREISLLIRSDGHANVVRYFTKEQKSDFVYLGLQLCDMTLKDFVVQVRGQMGAQSGADGSAVATAPSVVSEAVKCGLHQIAMGVAHLHAQRIVHRDIKPQNILLARVDDKLAAGDSGEPGVPSPFSMEDLSQFVLKISDMGLSKQLGRDHHSFSSMSLSIAAGHSVSRADPLELLMAESAGAGGAITARTLALQAAVGTVGWQAPELISHRYFRDEVPSPLDSDGSTFLAEERGDVVLVQEEADEANSDDDLLADETLAAHASLLKQLRRDRKKRTLTVDVFSLGCVFYFTITRGEHPFGQWFEREANIAAGKLSLDAVRHEPLVLDLLTWMLAADPLLRPTSDEVCGHPFFWTASSKLNFLVEFSDRMEHEPAESDMVLAVESGAPNVLGSRWDRRLDVLLLEDLGKFRKYDTASVRDLLRVIRNKRHHYHELSAPLKTAMGNIPDQFMSYFDTRFPRLVLHCAYVAHRYLAGEALFRPWARGTRSCAAAAARATMLPPGSTTTQVIPVQNPAATHPAPARNDTSTTAAERIGEMSKSQPWVDNVVVWQGGALAASLQCNGWWRNASEWVTEGTDSNAAKKNRPSHLAKSAADSKYRISLCSHWEDTSATACPMRKKGKCVFAHGPLELRVKEARRHKWGHHGGNISSGGSNSVDLFSSGGEDTLGAARSLSKGRAGTDHDQPRGRAGTLVIAGPPDASLADETGVFRPSFSSTGRKAPMGTPERYLRNGQGRQAAHGYNQTQRFSPPYYGDHQQQGFAYQPYLEPQGQHVDGVYVDSIATGNGFEFAQQVPFGPPYQHQHQYHHNQEPILRHGEFPS